MAWDPWKQFECRKCGRCCAQIGLPFYGPQLEPIADFLGVSKEAVLEDYYGTTKVRNGRLRVEFDDDKRTPCRFLLEDNMCRIYPVRPDGCRAYPMETDGGREGVGCPGHPRHGVE